MTTPKEAREQVTGMYTVNGREFTRLVYDLCDQVEALTAELAGYKKDAERLDWLDSQRVAYGFQQTHEGNKWEIEGPFRNLRVAIDDCRAAIAKGTA